MKRLIHLAAALAALASPALLLASEETHRSSGDDVAIRSETNATKERFKDWTALQLEAKKEAVSRSDALRKASNLSSSLAIDGVDFDWTRDEGIKHIINLVQAIDFVPVRPSLFRSEADIAPFIIGYGLETTEDSTLVKPMQVVSLFSDGVIAREPIYARQADVPLLENAESEDDECAGWLPGFSLGDASSATWLMVAEAGFIDNSTLSDSARSKPETAIRLFRFYASGIERPKADVARKSTEMDRDATGFSKGNTTYFDLNGDGIHDIAIWEGVGRYNAIVYGTDIPNIAFYRLAMVNIAGRWKVLGSDSFAFECGC